MFKSDQKYKNTKINNNLLKAKKIDKILKILESLSLLKESILDILSVYANPGSNIPLNTSFIIS